MYDKLASVKTKATKKEQKSFISTDFSIITTFSFLCLLFFVCCCEKSPSNTIEYTSDSVRCSVVERVLDVRMIFRPFMS